MAWKGDQTKEWIRHEADAWHVRNHRKFGQSPDRIIDLLKELKLFPKSAFEIGCGNGWRLKNLQDTFGCEVSGCDVSNMALNDAQIEPLHMREAKRLEGISCEYDLVIYGFSLYACDPKDLFKIVAEGDRILQDKGHLVIYDFAPEVSHSRVYIHDPRLRTYKHDYAKLWLANPVYSLVASRFFPHEEGEEVTEDTRVAVTVLHKNIHQAFPLRT